MMGFTVAGNHWNLGLGDKIQFCSFPENYYRYTGEKIVDIDKTFLYDYNPYVLRDVKYDKIIDLWHLGNEYLYGPIIPSIAERTCLLAGITKTYLRHPRFYIHENIPMKRGQICVHLTGKTAPPPPEEVVIAIRENYSDFDIIQIGGKEDIHYPFFKNALGLEFFDSCKIIAESTIFIGVSSSMMNAALAYPRTNKRIIITEKDESVLENMIPMDVREGHYHWLDHSFCLFNKTERDIGVSFTFRKI
jgi:hypothetical protein